MIKPKVCPFCGSEKWEIAVGYFVYCIECAAEGPTGSTKEEAIEKWNERR